MMTPMQAGALTLVAMVAIAMQDAHAARPAPVAAPAASRAESPTVEPWAPDLRERIEHVPVRVRDVAGRESTAELPVTVFRPAGPGPFPLAVISHGRDLKARASYERQRYESAARFFIRKGYAVAVPLRLGYGELASLGDPESSGSCNQPHYAPALKAAADQITAVLRFMATQPDIDPGRTVLIGQSVGGLASLAALEQQPAGILAVINVSGGHGGRADTEATPCRPDLLQQQLTRLGALQHRQPQPVPTLWLYADNDRFFGAGWPRQWADAYSAAGGRVNFTRMPPVGADGHRLFTEANDRWQPVVDAFLRPLGVEIPGAMPYPPEGDRGAVAVEDEQALPTQVTELRRLYRDFLGTPLPRAFAMNGQTRSAYAYGDDAQSRALARCEAGAQAEEPCRLYAVNRTVVWSFP